MAMSKENAIIKDGILYEVMEGSCLSCDMSKHCVTSPHKPCKVFGDNVRLVIQREYMHLYICLSEEIINTPEYDKEDDEFTGEIIFKDGAGFTEYLIQKDIVDMLICSNGPQRGFSVRITIDAFKLDKVILDDIMYHFVNNKVSIVTKKDSFPSGYIFSINSPSYCEYREQVGLNAQIVINFIVSKSFLSSETVRNLKINKTMKNL